MKFYLTLQRGLPRLLTLISAVFLLVQLFVAQTAWAAADNKHFPKLTDYVVDSADILDSNARSDIATFLSRYAAQTGNQIVVATIPSLAGEDVVKYTDALSRHWHLDKAGRASVLLLTAMQDRKMYLKVINDPTGKLTDDQVQSIVDDVLVSAFARGKYAQGIEAAVKKVTHLLGGQQKSTMAASQSTASSPQRESYFIDNINLVDAKTREEINRFLSNLERAKATKIVVVSQDSIKKMNPVNYMSALFSAQKLRKDDILLLIAQNKNGKLVPRNPEAKRFVAFKFGNAIKRKIADDTHIRLVDKLELADAKELSLSLQAVVQKLAEIVDDKPSYPPLLKAPNFWPTILVSALLATISLIGIYTVSGGVSRFICHVLFIDGGLMYNFFFYFQIDKIPHYELDDSSLAFVAYFLVMLALAIPLNLLRMLFMRVFSSE